MNLLRSTKSKITENENGENVRYLEINEVLLVHCSIVNNSYQQNSTVLYTFGQLLDIFIQKFYIFKNICLKIFIYWSMVYWSKFSATRDRR